jgi:phenylpropionate dioxygenase-like ring-hydroxylating dioxygenase large terminal subunit
MKNPKLVHSSFYTGENIKKIEFEKIFSKNWFFAGMTSDLVENNSFITLEIFNYPIVIQNFKGVIKAFQNICPHRFNKIQTEQKGKRVFMCQYHNWSFDENGLVKTIPRKQAFEIDEHNCPRVKNLKLAIVGKFIFVSINPEVSDIEEYLGTFYQKLIEISNAIHTNFYFDDDSQKINWKIVVENVIEAYHCPAIHQNTLFGMGFCRISETNQEYDKFHSVADYPKSEMTVESNKILKYLEKRTFQHDTFRHFYIFPNLLISSTEGTSIYIGNILPVNSDNTVLRKRFFDVHFETDYVPKAAIHNAFLEMAKTSINSILAEDKVVLEEIQKNIPFVDNYYFLGEEENRIKHFHQQYLQLLNE